jgi:O-acetyl-ADP-ribose deacetylase (regulator of RNase III)
LKRWSWQRRSFEIPSSGSKRPDAIVSPANSFGFIDGGIDLAYSLRFGWSVQERLRQRLRPEHDGELPVGQAIIVPTDHADIPFVISAPTMRIPMDVSTTVNAYLAFRAAIRAAREHNRTASRPLTPSCAPAWRRASVACPTTPAHGRCSWPITRPTAGGRGISKRSMTRCNRTSRCYRRLRLARAPLRR